MALTATGVGIGLRRELCPAVWESSRQIDWLEIIPENFIGMGGRAARTLEIARERFALRAHGVSMNMCIDNHGRPVADEVWSLFELALERVPACPVLLEWDLDIPSLDAVHDEADQARVRLARVLGQGSGQGRAA